LNIHTEIKEVFGHLRNTLNVHREMGLDPPHISFKDLVGPMDRTSDASDDSDTWDRPDTLKDLMDKLGDCRGCKLHDTRTRLVFGEGAPQARLVFVGEGPGRDEDIEGRPFVGEAGKLLTKIIENGMGLARKDVYICNVVKCRPPKNRDPEADEIQNCLPILRQQLKIIQPEAICALGRVASQAMIGGDFSISRQRGQWTSYMGIPLMPTYHPAYLLRKPAAKRQVWNDVQLIMKRLGLEVKKP
jgi:uracil-DNA glycosylase family 4